ncbi:MAG: hypothetical protein QG639_698 [Patescibacteria group bacterium]|nr:hypothetical protein [Patescibacteria group bacterium]
MRFLKSNLKTHRKVGFLLVLRLMQDLSTIMQLRGGASGLELDPRNLACGFCRQAN